jgi:thiosulfate/3-mercaptopyruvate sulfurtransferase
MLYSRGMANIDLQPLVSASWLADHIGDANLRIVDARWRGDGSGHKRYVAGHIPGAIHIDWHSDLNHTVNGVRDLLLPPERFAAVLQAAGIGDDSAVVAYAETDHSGAARLWWALRYYGHAQVAVLDGGLSLWRAEGRALEIGEAAPIAVPPTAQFTAQIQEEWMATADEIGRANQAAGGDVALVDTRPAEQYEGMAVWTPLGSRHLEPGETTIDIGARGRMRPGHIPGAVHLHASANLDPNTWTYLPPEALQARAQTAGIRPEQRVITYCGVGISASLGLFSLYLAGYRNLALYDASWEEWGTDPTRPVE